MSTSSTVTRASLSGAVAGDIVLTIKTQSASPAPTAYTVTDGTIIQSLPTRGIGYKVLGAADDVTFGENSTDTTYEYTWHAIALHNQQSIATDAIHAVTETASVTTTQPCMILAFSNGPITKAGSTALSVTYATAAKLYISRWDLAMPGSDTWSSTGTWWSTVAVWGTTEVTGGRPKAYVTGSWQTKPAKVYIGGQWVEKPMKRHNGTAWVPLT